MTRRYVLLLAAVLFLANLWGYDLWAPDEPYFAEGAREMIVDGHWIVPHVNGVVTTDKPPLFFWLIALVSLPFGQIYSITARLPSVLAALGTLLLILRIGGRRCRDGRTAVLAAGVLCTSFMFWEKARWTQIESTLCFLIWVALSAFEAFRAGEADGRRAGLLFWSAAALAVLAKGPVGLLLPLGIALVTLATDRDLGAWRRFAPWLGPACFAGIVGAWMLLATVGGDGDYSVWGALKEHFVDRGIHGLHHKRPWYFYLVVLPPQLMPWAGLVPGALVLAARRRDATDRFLLVAAFFVVVFFSVSTEKRELYVLPAYPAFALMVARLLGLQFGWEAGGPALIGRRWVTVGQGIVGGFLLLGGGVLIVTGGERFPDAPYWLIASVGTIFAATGIATLAALGAKRLGATALIPGVGFALAYLVTAFVFYPAMEPRKSARSFALRLKEVTAESRAAGQRVLSYDLGNLPEPVAFYSNGMYTIETWDPAELARHLDQDAQVYAAVHAPGLDNLPPELRQRIVVVERHELARRRVWIVTNGPHPGGEPL